MPDILGTKTHRGLIQAQKMSVSVGTSEVRGTTKDFQLQLPPYVSNGNTQADKLITETEALFSC